MRRIKWILLWTTVFTCLFLIVSCSDQKGKEKETTKATEQEINQQPTYIEPVAPSPIKETSTEEDTSETDPVTSPERSTLIEWPTIPYFDEKETWPELPTEPEAETKGSIDEYNESELIAMYAQIMDSDAISCDGEAFKGTIYYHGKYFEVFCYSDTYILSCGGSAMALQSGDCPAIRGYGSVYNLCPTWVKPIDAVTFDERILNYDVILSGQIKSILATADDSIIDCIQSVKRTFGSAVGKYEDVVKLRTTMGRSTLVFDSETHKLRNLSFVSNDETIDFTICQTSEAISCAKESVGTSIKTDEPEQIDTSTFVRIIADICRKLLGTDIPLPPIHDETEPQTEPPTEPITELPTEPPTEPETEPETEPADVETELVQETVSDWLADIEPTCTEEGTQTRIVTYAVVSKVTGNKLGTVDKVEHMTIPALGHVELKTVGLPATCTTEGRTESIICSRCNTVIEEARIIPATGHKQQTVIGKSATCTASGLTDGVKCPVCGTWLTKQTTIPASGHKWTTIEAKSPTCTQKGSTEGTQCSVCKTWQTKPIDIPAIGHIPVTKPGKDATCTEPGLTDGTQCAICHTWIKQQISIKATGHKWADGVFVDSIPSYTHQWTGRYLCVDCGAKSDPVLMEPLQKTADWTISLSSTVFNATGSPIEPKIIVLFDGNEINSIYYKVEYSNNINIGTASITVTAIDGDVPIIGSKTVMFTIK